MPRTSRAALLGALALAAALGNAGLALTGGAGIDWSTTSVFYTATTPEEESTGLMPANARVPSKWLSAASLAFIGPLVARIVASRQPLPLNLPELQVLSHLKVPVLAPDAAVGDTAGRAGMGRAGLPTALLLTACAALGLRAAHRRTKGSSMSRGSAASSSSSLASLASSEESPEEPSAVAVAEKAAEPVVGRIPIQSAEQLPYPTKFFRIMTDANQEAPEEVQQPAEFYRIMTDAEVLEAPKDFSRSVTVPCVAEVESLKKQPTPPSTIDEIDEEEDVHPSMAMLRGSTEPVLEEKKTKPESKNTPPVAEVGRRGYVQTMRQKIEERGLSVRAH